MPFFMGIVHSGGVAPLGKVVGLDRDRAFDPSVLIVIESYYVRCVTTSSSSSAILVESVAAVAFEVATFAGLFRSSLWIAATALVGHGIFDAVRGLRVENPGVPVWLPVFCLFVEVGAGVYVASVLGWRARQGRG